MKSSTVSLTLALLATIATAHASDAVAPVAAPVPPIKVPKFLLSDSDPAATGAGQRFDPFANLPPALPPAIPAHAASGPFTELRAPAQMPMTSGKPTDLRMPMVEPTPGIDYKLLIARSEGSEPRDGIAQALRLPGTRDPR